MKSMIPVIKYIPYAFGTWYSVTTSFFTVTFIVSDSAGYLKLNEENVELSGIEKYRMATKVVFLWPLALLPRPDNTYSIHLTPTLITVSHKSKD